MSNRFEVTLTVFISADTEAQAREIVEDNLGCFDGFYLGGWINGVKADSETKPVSEWIEP